jgi:hypothetical protein
LSFHFIHQRLATRRQLLFPLLPSAPAQLFKGFLFPRFLFPLSAFALGFASRYLRLQASGSKFPILSRLPSIFPLILAALTGLR